MPAYSDKEIILGVNNLKDVDFRATQLEVLHDYIVACDLSRGPDPNRSEHWTAKAVVLRLKLQDALKSHTEAITCSPAHNP